MSGKRFLTKGQVERFIGDIPDGAMFAVIFEKQDGTLRQMTCRTGVTKHLKGGEATYNSNPDNYGVFDVNVQNDDGTRGAYRCFNVTRVVRIRGNGTELVATDAPLEATIHDAQGREVAATK